MSRKRTAVVCGKLTEAPEGDYYVTCSFDPNHVLLKSRMPYHIIKCVKQHPNHNKVQCPFDSTEYVDVDEFQNHILVCEAKRSIAYEKYQTAELKASGSMCNIKPAPYFHAFAPDTDEEDWGGSSVQVDDEFAFENLAGVGRANRSAKIPQAKKGVGRAKILKRILENYKRSSLSSDTSGPSEKENPLRENVKPGQFEDD